MYTLVSTYLKPKGLSEPYEDVDISLKTLKDIKTNYIDGYIELSNPSLTDNIFITIEEFRELKLPMRDDHTFEYWLRYIGNRTITGTEIRPDYITRVVKARNAYQSGYKVDLCKRSMAPDAAVPIGDMNDLYVRKENINPNILRTRSLVTVNGFLHPHAPHYDGIAVVGGGNMHKTLGDTQVGIWSFSEVADIQMVPITENMIHRFKDGISLGSKAVIDLGHNLENKSIIVSIAGYPLIGSKVAHILSDTTGVIKIDVRAFDPITKVIHAYGKINLNNLGITYDPTEESLKQFTSVGIKSDVVIKKLLTLPQSFIAIIDTPTLSISREPVPITGLPGRLIQPSEPNLPIIDSYGACPEYWIKNQNVVHVINLPHTYYEHHLFETRFRNTFDRFNSAIDVYGYNPHLYEYLKIISVKLDSEHTET